MLKYEIQQVRVWMHPISIQSFQVENCSEKEMCPGTDCEVGEWMEWSDCSVSCIDRNTDSEMVYVTRAREIITQPDQCKNS
jgi:hypothetical protein